jgi:hypothetical protein
MPEGAWGKDLGPGAYFSGIRTVVEESAQTGNSRRKRRPENVPARSRKMSQPTTDLAEKIQSILALKDLTLYQVSQRSEKLYGRSSPYFLPHNLYFDLRGGTFSPSIYQFFALSRITGYRLSDWLRLFGADLESIVRLQTSLPSRRTILLDSSLADPYVWVPWFRNRIGNSPAPPIAPLGQLLGRSGPNRLGSLSESNGRGFLYAKIGYQDALAFPDLFPGSIVRVNPEIPDKLAFLPNGVSSRIFLIEHSKGLFCCRLRIVGDSVIVPVSTKVSYAQVELRRPPDAKLLGTVDLEIRPLLMAKEPEVPKELAKQWKPRPLSREGKVGPLLRSARITMRLSLREASEISGKVADLLGDDRYFISPSSLCDYELLNTAPRHFQKAITLCSLYGIRFQTFLKTIGIVPEVADSEPMPDHFVSRVLRVEAAEALDTKVASGGFLERFLERCEEVPFFLRESIGSLSGLDEASLNDFFWIGGKYDVLHPYLTNGLLALVNRRKKKLVYFTSKPLWQQPLYVLLKRDGTYLCACCGLENGTLVVHPYSQQFRRPEQLRYHHDVEVVGQVVMVVRKVV